MDLSDASEKIPSDTTGDRSRDLPTSGVIEHKLLKTKQHNRILSADWVKVRNHKHKYLYVSCNTDQSLDVDVFFACSTFIPSWHKTEQLCSKEKADIMMQQALS